LAITAAYLLGAVPFGLLIARSRGIDIRQVGSRNIGATNVMRSVGKPWGILTFMLDALKGLLPTVLFPCWSGSPAGWLGIACALAAILGHNFPVYLKFKGGKGVATSAGALLGLAPAAMGLGLVVWAAFFFTLRYVSLASIVAALVIPAAGWWLYRDTPLLPGFLTLLGALIILRHRANIQRLLNGTENRFGRKEGSGGSVQGSGSAET
jgi:glycerol-3-phosphate acyltransferase PlsY